MSSSLGIGLVGAMLIVPQLTLIHPYLHLLIVAPLLVWVGCEGALMEHQKAPEDSQVQQVDSQSTTNFPGRTLSTRLPMRAAHRRPLRRRCEVETVTKKDAMRFPIVGSCVLFGLYWVIKLVKKEYLDALISIYFAVLGSFSIFACAQPVLTSALGMGGLKRFAFSFHWQRWKRREDAEPLAFDFSMFDVVVFGLCAAGSGAYAITKKWYLNNLLGCAFSIQGIQMLALGSWAMYPCNGRYPGLAGEPSPLSWLARLAHQSVDRPSLEQRGHLTVWALRVRRLLGLRYRGDGVCRQGPQRACQDPLPQGARSEAHPLLNAWAGRYCHPGHLRRAHAQHRLLQGARVAAVLCEQSDRLRARSPLHRRRHARLRRRAARPALLGTCICIGSFLTLTDHRSPITLALTHTHTTPSPSPSPSP